jgi:hypothetical protein
MPYVSEAQRGFFNANKKALEAKGVDVDEWNEASKGQTNLPEHVAKDHPLQKLRAKPRRM